MVAAPITRPAGASAPRRDEAAGKLKSPAALSMCDGAWRFYEPTSAGRKWAQLLQYHPLA